MFYLIFGQFLLGDQNHSGCANTQPDTTFPQTARNCLQALQIQLAIIFGLSMVFDNFVELVIPMITGRLAAKRERAFDEAGNEKVKTRPEEEFALAPYETTFDDFNELLIQYGYVVLFIVAFPLTPLLALICNFIEIRLDATKITKFSRRPFPAGASNIGAWSMMLQLISFVAVISNLAICIFYVDQINRLVSPPQWGYDTWGTKVWIFLITEHLVFILKFALTVLVDDEPQDLRVHVQRNEYLVDVLINGKKEEDDEDFLQSKLLEEIEASKGFKFDDVPKKPEPIISEHSLNKLN